MNGGIKSARKSFKRFVRLFYVFVLPGPAYTMCACVSIAPECACGSNCYQILPKFIIKIIII